MNAEHLQQSAGGQSRSKAGASAVFEIPRRRGRALSMTVEVIRATMLKRFARIYVAERGDHTAVSSLRQTRDQAIQDAVSIAEASAPQGAAHAPVLILSSTPY